MQFSPKVVVIPFGPCLLQHHLIITTACNNFLTFHAHFGAVYDYTNTQYPQGIY
jgi:hypothetical protein